MLAASGAVMQGLFRNPLADPALVGVSRRRRARGRDHHRGRRQNSAEASVSPCRSRCCRSRRLLGALIATALLYRLATREGRTSIAIFLLAGLAIAALANAAIGLLVFLADDRQLRDITFWMLGSLERRDLGEGRGDRCRSFWRAGRGLPFIARGLDLLVLGEAEAFHMGVAVQRLKMFAIVLVAAAAGAAVSVRRRDRLRRHRRAASACGS